jgi:transcriptional regulator with XRE-family HTH domain
MCKCGVCGGHGEVIDHARTGSLLREARIASGKTHADIATALGISRSMVCHLESGLRGKTSMTESKVKEYLQAVTA